MNEFFLSEEQMRKRKDVENEINRLEKLSSIGARLIEEKLKAPNDELDDHLVPQLDRIMESQNLQNIDKARELVVVGYEIDTSLANGISINETLESLLGPLTKFVKDLLQDEFPNATEVEAELVIRRAMDAHKEGFFVDTLLDEIEKRRNKMRELKNNE